MRPHKLVAGTPSLCPLSQRLGIGLWPVDSLGSTQPLLLLRAVYGEETVWRSVLTRFNLFTPKS